MVRWDSPLFTVPWDEELPVGDIWKAITAGVVKPPNAGTTAVRSSSCVTSSGLIVWHRSLSRLQMHSKR